VISAYTSSLAFDTNTAGGRGLLALFLTSKASGALIWAYGLGTCTAYGVLEDTNYAVSQ
jgi:hypothetical protein